MKKIYGITAALITVVMIGLLVACIAADRRSEKELEEIDAFIAQYEDTTSTWVRIEASHEETTTTADTDSTADTVAETTQETVPSYTVEELANLVLDQGINGDERKAYLGDRYDEVQAWIDANYQPPAREVSGYDYPSGSGVLTPESGVNYYYGVMETYYNLPMDGVVEWMHSLGYDYEYWVRDDGVKMFGPYVMVAADYSWMPKGSILETSLGLAMVCDTGEGGPYWTDIATCW